MAYKQPLVTVPPYIGISLSVDGQAIKKPNFMRRVVPPPDNSSDGVQSNTNATPRRPQPSNAVTFARRPHSDSVEGKHSGSSSAPVKLGKSTTENRVIQNKTQQQPSKSGRPEKSHSSTTRSSTDGSKSKEQITPESPQLQKPERSGSMPTASIISYSATRMVSNTSCSNNYSIPGQLDVKPNLTVNNVESTDLKTIKPALSSSMVASKGNAEIDMVYKLAAFPPNKPPRTRKRIHQHRPLGHQIRKPKEVFKRPEVMISFPKVPYASVNVSIKGFSSPRLKYFTLNRDNEDVYRTELTPVSIP